MTARNDSTPDERTVTLDDPVLLNRLRAGEEAAFDLLYDACASTLVRFAYSYVRSTAAAQDVVADTFAHLWDQRKSLEARYGLKAYLLAAVRYRALKTLRSEGRAARFMARFASEPADRPFEPAESNLLLDNADLEVVLRQAIRSLSEDRQRLVALRWWEGLTVPQIAHVLDLTVGAVEQRLLRVVSTLRQLLVRKL